MASESDPTCHEYDACPLCGCDWPPCQAGCVGRWQFRLWAITHPLAYRKHRRTL